MTNGIGILLSLAILASVAPGDPKGPDDQIVKNSAGELVEPWVAYQDCAGEVCAEAIHNPETGEYAAFNGDWMTGYESTGDGEEVVRRAFLDD